MIATALFVLLSASGQPRAMRGEPELRCDAGPVIRPFGGNDWIVYACDDGRSVVVVASAPNPANPFVFIVRPDGEYIEVRGEGAGDKRAAESAYEEVNRMTASDLTDLHRAAVAAGARP